MRILAESAIVFGLMLLNGILAMSELAMMSSRRGRLEQRAAQGDRGAKAALQVLDDPTGFLSTVQVGITLVGILAGAISGASFSGHLAGFLRDAGMPAVTADTLALAVVVAAITYLSLVVGELVPKRLALTNAEGIASRVAAPMAVLARLGAPLVWILRTSTNAILKLIGVSDTPASRVTEEEIRSLLAEGADAGIVKRVEHEMIEGIMHIADRSVRSIMTPRVEVIWLDVEASPETIRRTLAAAGHSRYPVCRRDLDCIVGVAHLRSLIDSLLAGGVIDLAEIAVPPIIVPEGTPILRVIERFRQSSGHLALVVDEYGSVEGVVSPADVLTAIAGELTAGPDDAAAEATQRADGSWLVDGRMEIHRAERILGLRDLSHDDEFATLAGFILWELGHMPTAGEAFVKFGLRFEVVDLDGRRIDKVLVEQVDGQRAAG